MKVQKSINNIINAGLITSVVLLVSDNVLAAGSHSSIDTNVSKIAKEISIVPSQNVDLQNSIDSRNLASIYHNKLTRFNDLRYKNRQVCTWDINVVFKDGTVGKTRDFNVCRLTGTTVSNSIEN